MTDEPTKPEVKPDFYSIECCDGGYMIPSGVCSTKLFELLKKQLDPINGAIEIFAVAINDIQDNPLFGCSQVELDAFTKRVEEHCKQSGKTVYFPSRNHRGRTKRKLYLVKNRGKGR